MKAKYDTIGRGYNSTRKADPFLTSKLSELLGLKSGGLYLDIGCGTGNYSHELERQGHQWIGIDPSERMLETARRRNKKVDWRMGSAENLDLPSDSIDGGIAFLTIHHWTDLQKGLSELHRVLKPDANLVIFTSTPEQMAGYWLNHYFPRMLEDSMEQMPSLARLETAIDLSPFEARHYDRYFVKPDLEDLFLYCGKNKPTIYLDQDIRNGISSFSSLANQAEVAEGLENLKRDIDNGKINSVIAAYENDLGDYLFVSAKKAK